MVPPPDEIRDRLRRARALAGLHAHELGALAGLAEAHVGAIERGTIARPSAATLSAIARVLGVSLDWLIDGRGELAHVCEQIDAARRTRIAAATTDEASLGTRTA